MKAMTVLSRAFLTISIMCFVKNDLKARVVVCLDIILLLVLSFVEGLLTGRGTI